MKANMPHYALLTIIALVFVHFTTIAIVADSFVIDQQGIVARVIDGDTFNLTSGEQIRLADIDSPEQGEGGFLDATNYLIGLFTQYGWRVFLDIDNISRTDQYGRLVCVVLVNYNLTYYLNVNKAMAEGGQAKIIDYTNNEFNPDSWPLTIAKDSIDTDPPVTSHNYDGLWRATDFEILLTAKDDFSGVDRTFYRINSGQTLDISNDGQPLITAEGANNTLEYWSLDNVQHEENHHVLRDIKLDKTVPSIETPVREPDGDVTLGQPVRISVNISDSGSGLQSVRLLYRTNQSDVGVELSMGWNGTSRVYERIVGGEEANTLVKFAIIAFDNVGNNATNDNAGQYYSYSVIYPSLDLNTDGIIDMNDLDIVKKSFGSNTLLYDVNGPRLFWPDGKVDLRDIGLIARHFGEHS